MTPSERERRIGAAARGIWDDIARRIRERGYEPHETFETTPGRDAILSNAEAALDAADEAVPMVSLAALREKAAAGDHEFFVDMHTARVDAEQRAERAEAAARDMAQAIRRWLSETGPGMHTNTALGRGMARQALARHPSFSGEEGTERRP